MCVYGETCFSNVGFSGQKENDKPKLTETSFAGARRFAPPHARETGPLGQRLHQGHGDDG